MSVRICQCLCPSRHCIMAVAFEPGEWPDEKAQLALAGIVNKLVEAKIMNPWCGICRAPIKSWTYQADATLFDTLEAAQPVLKAFEQAQMRTAATMRNTEN